MNGYKNPALSRVNGVLTAHCCICQKWLGDEYSESFYKLIRQKYCNKCAAKVEQQNNIFGQGNFRKNRKRTFKEMRSFMDTYRKEIRIQQEVIAELQRELDDLKRRR